MNSPTSRFWRKKPVTIEAVQWFKMGDHPKVELYAHGDDKGQEHLGCIKTLESGKTGFHIVSVGDWIIKGVKGEYYACKPDIFALTYEPVDAPASENEAPVPAGIVQTYTAKIERDAVIIKTLRDKLVELCDRLNWKGPGRESNIEITVREARAIVKSFDQIAAGVAFITDERLGGP